MLLNSQRIKLIKWSVNLDKLFFLSNPQTKQLNGLLNPSGNCVFSKRNSLSMCHIGSRVKNWVESGAAFLWWITDISLEVATLKLAQSLRQTAGTAVESPQRQARWLPLPCLTIYFHFSNVSTKKKMYSIQAMVLP